MGTHSAFGSPASCDRARRIQWLSHPEGYHCSGEHLVSYRYRIVGEDVHAFRPDRFVGIDAAPREFSTANTQEFGCPVFGFGRRVCSGSQVAFATLFILCSSILSTMAILPAIGDDGNEITPEVEHTSGIIVYAKPFDCRIIARSEKSIQLIKAAI